MGGPRMPYASFVIVLRGGDEAYISVPLRIVTPYVEQKIETEDHCSTAAQCTFFKYHDRIRCF
jgi:hypothetical protein